MADKLRIHQLAKELGVNSKAILTKCTAEGVEVKNHMSTVSAGLAATIREWFSDHSGTSTAAAEKAAPVDVSALRKARTTDKRKKKDLEPPHPPASDDGEEIDTQKAAQPAKKKEAPMPPPHAVPMQAEEAGSTAVALEEPPVLEQEPITEVAEPPEPEPVPVEEPLAPEEPLVPEEPPRVAAELEAPPAPLPAGPQNVPTPARVTGPRVIRVEAPEPIRRPPPRTQAVSVGGASTEEGAAADARAGRRGRSKTYQGTSEEEAEKKRRAARRKHRGSDAGEQLKEWRDQDLAERRERIRGATGRRAKRRASEASGAVIHRVVTSADVQEPIILKNFCSSTGISMAQLSPKLINELRILPQLNMVLEKDLAEMLAADFGIELRVIEARSPLDSIRDEFAERERNVKPRAPVVTFLGHVDHGKTSLLDAIRHSRVTQTEAGGITQHMGSYHLERDGLSVTFLDTPGHQAFTAMRARGAQLTDVVVLVVAADDGIMPQTVEAINHAKAAQVPIVVALNKIDLQGVDFNQVYGQLAEHDLAPSEWGGSTDVIKTSATLGTGIDELVEHLSTLSDLLELQADPDAPACGRVIESEMKPGVGAVARVLIQDGSVRVGDVIVCGPGFGKVRSLKDDQGAEMIVAGPAMPVEISGLDELPSAGDELYHVESLKRAEEVASEIKEKRRRKALIRFQKPTSLEDLFSSREAGEIPELNIIIKADTQGSAAVLQKSLAELPSDEVKLNILHSGVGGIIESDVVLAEASGAIVIGFQVVPDTAVRRIADDKRVDIRLYRVIYNVTDDIKKALEGLLEPTEELQQRGAAEVRDVFKVSKIGTVAGCVVRDGTISRSHRTRIIRDGVVVRDGADIDSLKRFKDDVKEVKVGYECGVKISGFDDVKPGDIIECYEVVKVARTL